MPEVDWFAIQENTFTRWCNDQLAERGRHIDDLKTGLKDGIALIHIIEVVSDKKIGKYNEHPKIEIQKVENLNLAFEFIKKQNIKLVNISAEDIITGNLRLILGLLWTLIQEYDIGADGGDGLLKWVQSKIPDYNVLGWKKDWNDGRAVNALIDAICPGLMPGHASLDPANAVENCKLGIELAHNKLGVDPRVLAEEMAHPKVDKNAMQTYIAQFRNVSEETIKKALAGERPAYHELANAYGNGLSGGVVGDRSEVFVEVSADCDEALQVEVVEAGQRLQAQGMARDQAGLYSCHYVPTVAGECQVHVTLGGQHVSGSPFAVTVLQKESLGGEGKIRVFFSTTQMAGKARSDVRDLEHLLKLKQVHLRQNFEPWHPIDLMEREDREAVFRKAGTRALPIVFVNDEYVGDYDRLQELDDAGQLDRILDLSDKDMLSLEEHMARLRSTEAASANASFQSDASFAASPKPAPVVQAPVDPAPPAELEAEVQFVDLQDDYEEEEFTDIPEGGLDLQVIDGLQD